MSVFCMEMVIIGVIWILIIIGIIVVSYGIGVIIMMVRIIGGVMLVFCLRLSGDIVIISEMLKRKEKKRKM